MNTIMKSMRTAVMLTAILLSVLQMIAQNASSGIIPDTPPSPQAVAFNRLGDYQVSNNYGAPDISIPLFEIDRHGYKIPLTLRYEASPLKPGYNYDVTGIGWTLSGNSCVSRTIKDRADENGLYNNPFKLDPFYFSSSGYMRYIDYADELDQQNHQYDSYNIILPSGRSIPFYMYMDEHNVMQYTLLPSDSHVRISCSYQPTGAIDSFTVTDEHGVTYYFAEADCSITGFESDPNSRVNVTWLLTSIDIPSKGAISYEYTDVESIFTFNVDEPVLRVSRMMSQMPEDVNERRVNVIKTLQTHSPRYKMRFLSRISYGPTLIGFNYYADNHHMKEIVVSDGGNRIRKITFGLNINNSYGSTLTSLVISGQGDTDKLAYGFTYTNIMPGNKTDYWGNRCDSNPNADIGNFNMYIDNDGVSPGTVQTQLNSDGNPALVINNKPDDLSYYFKLKLQASASGDSRLPTPPQYHGVLSSITYPNGGITFFNWENHRFPTITAADGDLVFDRRRQRIIEGGGFRIESIKSYTADGQTAGEDYYRYGFRYMDIMQRNFPLPIPSAPDVNNINAHIGCGEAVVDPNLLTFMTFSHATYIDTSLEFHKMVVGLPSAFRTISNANGSASWWDAYFSANTFQSLLGGRRPVVYPEVTVYHGHPYDPSECKGKTVYRYDIYGQHNSASHYLSCFNQTPMPDTTYFEPVYYHNNRYGLRCIEYPAKRHQLKSK